MTLVNSKDILVEGRKRQYGVLGLLGGNLESVIGMVKAAEELRSPLILVYNEEVNPKVRIELGMPMIVHAAKIASIPVGTILDHGHDLVTIAQAIEYGASSVMFDGSGLPYDENLTRTKEVVDYAHSKGVCVEAELGSIAGSVIDVDDNGPSSTFTDPEIAADFVLKTGVDSLAISFGNAHGIYQGQPQLDLERVRQIAKAVQIPLVMHGGSGLDDRLYPMIVESGITKVCYYTTMARGAFQEIMTKAEKGSHNGAYHDLISWSIDYFYRDTCRLLKLVGCAGTV
jgi:fructose-bisphosphate aldolase, class II